MFTCVTCWCVCGASRIWDGSIGVVYVYIVSVGLGAMFSTVVPKMVTSCCNALPCHPWKVWFSFLIFWMARIRFVAFIVDSSIGVSVGMVQFLCKMLLTRMFGTYLWKGCGIFMPYTAHSMGCNIMHQGTWVSILCKFLVHWLLLSDIQAEQRVLD